jgi:hypothetical protein
MKPHRTDGVSLTFALIFLAVAAWWLVAQTVDLALPAVGWFVAGGLILFGLLGLLGALRSARTAARPTSVSPTSGSPISAPPATSTPPSAEGDDRTPHDVEATGFARPVADGPERGSAATESEGRLQTG